MATTKVRRGKHEIPELEHLIDQEKASPDHDVPEDPQHKQKHKERRETNELHRQIQRKRAKHQ